MKVGIQGIRGAFHEVAAREYFGQTDIEPVPFITFDNLIEAVVDHDTDFGMVAIENTIAGTIHANLNLVRQYDVKICGEIFIRISQNLAVLPGVKIEDLTEVRSHYMAIIQTHKYFRNFPNIRLVESEDTALSMKDVAENKLQTVGAIGSTLAAELYGLEVIAANIETNKKNYTRFLVIGPTSAPKPTNFNKASLNIKLPNKKGSLSKILSIIAFYDIDLTKIESLPIVGEPWSYMFYVDVKFDNIQHYNDMLTAIRPLTREINVLGEYEEAERSFNLIHNQ